MWTALPDYTRTSSICNLLSLFLNCEILRTKQDEFVAAALTYPWDTVVEFRYDLFFPFWKLLLKLRGESRMLGG